MTDINIDAPDDETAEAPASDTNAPELPQIGTFVTYLSSKGKPQVALVLATSESVDGTTSLSAPDAGHLNILVFSPSGRQKHYPNVPFAGDSEDEQPTKVWTPTV